MSVGETHEQRYPGRSTPAGSNILLRFLGVGFTYGHLPCSPSGNAANSSRKEICDATHWFVARRMVEDVLLQVTVRQTQRHLKELQTGFRGQGSRAVAAIILRRFLVEHVLDPGSIEIPRTV